RHRAQPFEPGYLLGTCGFGLHRRSGQRFGHRGGDHADRDGDMSARNRELETGCHALLITLVVVGCFAGIPPLFEFATQAIAQASIAPQMLFSWRSCGQIENVHEVTLGEATHNTSTVSGEGLTLMIAL